MNTSIKRAVWTVAALTLINLTAHAGDDVNGSPGSMDGSKPSVPQREGTYGDQGNYQNDPAAGRRPQACDRASGIIGMDVQNQQGEHLGHIKDIVLDINTQKVTYVVMTPNSKAMPFDDKLLAVPLSAFTVSSDQKHLVLNTDKSRVEAATGFTSTNWPVVGTTSWSGQQQFWQQEKAMPENTTPGQNNMSR